MSHELNLNIDQLAEGAVGEKIVTELERIAENILDLNTDSKKARVLTIKLNFVPNDNRTILTTRVDVTSKLAPSEETETTFLIGQDYNTGFMAMNELKSNTPGQTYINPDDGKLKTDIGEDIDEIEEKEKTQIIDYNARKSN